MSGRPAVFLDRDGTLVEDRRYLRDPALLHLLPGASEAVRRLNAAAIPAVVVTNQSGIARGLLGQGARVQQHAARGHARDDRRLAEPQP